MGGRSDRSLLIGASAHLRRTTLYVFSHSFNRSFFTEADPFWRRPLQRRDSEGGKGPRTSILADIRNTAVMALIVIG
jgi:hypothetical protein